ncbi:MAG: flagellar hook protein FlgE, partial [Sulfurimonas sp. RIFCSPLOWO2_12_FULL_36_74]
MLKSLFAGVSGLQSHQVAMDVESNNIANVNTVGFKYSRANFSDLLAQTRAIATAPQGELGGKNPVQVGLGATVSSMTRIFSQGSVQNSDKNTDVAIQGDGFFIISPDGGNTYKYTRAGDFKFDAGGNFVDNNGFIVQGWLRDSATGYVDATAPITNINIPPGLTTPASATQNVTIKANLNSGPLIETFSPEYEVPAGTPPALPIPPALDENGNPIESGNMGVMFNEAGEAFSLQTDQGIWASFLSSTTTAPAAVSGGAAELDLTFELDDGTTKQITTSGALATNTADQNGARFVSAINAQTSVTGISASYDTITDSLTFVNSNSNPNASHNIRLTTVGAGDGSGFAATTVTTAWRYQYDPTAATKVAGSDKTFTTIADLREALENQANADGGGATSNVEISVNSAGKFELKNPGGSANDYNINLSITGMSAASIPGGGITENTKFTRNMEALNSTLPTGSTATAFSQSFNAATHSASIDIFDSLGSKHTLRTEFRKV